MPRRGSFKTLYDAMQLGACDVAGPSTTDEYAPPNNTVKGAAFYVDGVNGNNAASGTLAAPFQTLGKAIEAATTSATKTIFLRAGVFHGEKLLNRMRALSLARCSPIKYRRNVKSIDICACR